MSEESPEKVEIQPEESAPKKKAAKKRIKAPEAKVIENESNEPKTPENTAPRKEEESSEPGPTVAVVEEGRPAREEGETPTENPSIRRISSKRMSQPETPSKDDASEQTATFDEPAASSDVQGRKRRRRRRKGQGGEADEGPVGNEGGNPSRGDEVRPQQRPVSRLQIDPEKIEKKAWKIFLSEVSEEGLALVSDQDAKEIGRRSFRLAEIFLEEASKRQ